MRLIKHDIVKDISNRTGFREKDVAVVYEAFLDSVKDALLRGDEVLLKRIGKFCVVWRKPRKFASLNNIGETIDVMERRYLKFVLSANFREALKDKDYIEKAVDENDETD